MRKRAEQISNNQSRSTKQTKDIENTIGNEMPSSFILVRGKVPNAIAAQRRVTIPASFTNSEFPKQYALYTSIILDSGLTTYVYNNINRFIEY